MNIIIGLTKSKKLADEINNFIMLSDELSKDGQVNVPILLSKIDKVEASIKELLSKKLTYAFMIDCDTYEELDKKLVGSELRGEFFCSVNDKERSKELYKEIEKALTNTHKVSKNFKDLLEKMEDDQFCICWNCGEDEANEFLQNN